MTKQPKYPQPWLLKLTILQGNVLLENNTSGALCISQAWPGMARTIYKDHKRFLETYLTPYPGEETLWQVMAEVFGLVHLGLPAFCTGQDFGELALLLHSTTLPTVLRPFISPCLRPHHCPGNGLLSPTFPIGSHVVLGQWIFPSASNPLEHREASWCISCKPCWLLSLIQRH